MFDIQTRFREHVFENTWFKTLDFYRFYSYKSEIVYKNQRLILLFVDVRYSHPGYPGTRGCGGRWLGLLVRGRVPGVLVAEPGYHPGDVKIPESVHEEHKVVFLNKSVLYQKVLFKDQHLL